ncbi:hypothetical protein KR018_011224 [Drosophila ironensis]|nr:hypothetical protein KR018_011224 [Drosophila ironensis]
MTITPCVCLVKFQNGSFDGNGEFAVVAPKSGGKKQALVKAGGQFYAGELKGGEEYDTYVCIRDKETGKMHIIPVEQALLSNHVYKKLEREKRKAPLLSREHANMKLLKEFGGRKASRYVDNQEKMVVNVDVVRQDLDETVKSSTLRDQEEGQEEGNESLGDVSATNEEYLASIVPKFDKEATNLDRVFLPEDVVGSALLDRLEEEAKMIHAKAATTLPFKSDYLKECVARIQSKGIASKQDFLHIKLIIYMDALRNLISLRSRQIQKAELSGITEKVENDIKRRFADPNLAKRGARTNYTTEKALTHFIVLAVLISDKKEVDLNVLSQALATSKDRIKQYAHIVNVLPKSRSDILALRLPSKVPALKTASRFKRKM